MGEKIIVGKIDKGLKNDVKPFQIDNDSFPVLFNSYQWRGRIRRKRGTEFLCRLTRQINTTSVQTDGAGNYNNNLITVLGLVTTATIAFNSIVIGADVFTDTTPPTGVLTGSTSGSGTINYSTGALTITGGPATTNIQFQYYPGLPVLGLEDFVLPTNAFPGTIAFDTTYSYSISNSYPYPVKDISYYKNPTTSGSYTQKTTPTPITWNSQDYQQYYSVNYQGALWVTNGVTVPFVSTNIGMQFNPITTVHIVTAGNGTTIPAVATLTIEDHGLVIGDFLFINEVTITKGINFQTGFVTAIVDGNNVTVTFTNAILSTGAGDGAGGIAQYLTNRSDATKDGIRWYDGDPTSATGLGWVNFAPPISQSAFSIGDLPAAQYYLVGCKIIYPFKDRLLFIGPVVQSSGGKIAYLQDTVIYSQNGTPYYTASYTNTPIATVDNPTSPTNVFIQILVPTNQTATSPAYFGDQTGFGGNITAGIDQPINTLSSVDDVLILGFSYTQTRFVYSGNDIIPFNFFIINSELGSGSTFSNVNMDKGCLTMGRRGFIATSQVECKRIDLDIPDEIFEIRLFDNGSERICAQRDFINEWVYFTFPYRNNVNHKFPTATLQFNYRDNSWALFGETYTTYGSFQRQTGFVWETVGFVYPTWNSWNDPWEAGESTLLQPQVIGGTPQGFVMIRGVGTYEGTSVYIQSFTGSVITSVNHSLIDGDYILITGCIGTIGQYVNNQVFSINLATDNTFNLANLLGTGTYLGGGLITKMYVPFVQTKQFPTAWELGRKTRLGPQQYLLTGTEGQQIQLLIYLSTNDAVAYNSGSIVPDTNVDNSSLIYSTVLYTCPESTNLGLTAPNQNLQMPGASLQNQIWHRVNTSLIGDTIQLGFTLSNKQMLSLDGGFIGTGAITGATQANPCVLTCVNFLSVGQLIKITCVVGMTQLNFNPSLNNYYNVIAVTANTITIQVDSTLFTPYISGGLIVGAQPLNQFAEIEIFGFILDVNPSQLLC